MYGKSLRAAALIFMLIITSFLLQVTEGTDSEGSGEKGEDSVSYLSSGGSHPMMIHTHWGLIHIDYLSDIIPTGAGDGETDYWIVQFDGPIGKDMRGDLVGADAIIIDYIPDFAYIINLNSLDTEKILNLNGVVGISPYLDGLKITPGAYSILMEDGAEQLYGSDSLLISLFEHDPATIEEISRYAKILSIPELDRIIVSLPLISFESLLAVDGISFIEPKLEFEIHNDVAMGIIEVDTIRERYGLDGTGQTVGIADTGLDTGVDDHQVDGDIIADVDNRVAFGNWAGTSPDDTHSHGTHVTGSVAGNGSLSNGNVTGMAPNASIFFQGIASDTNQLTGIPSNLSQLFYQAYENGSRVHTNSWGSSDYTRDILGSYTSYSREVDWFTYHYPDMTILFSAGNNGVDWFPSDGKIDEDSIGPPGTSKNAITVGASENYRTTGGSQTNWSVKRTWYYNGSYHYLYNYPMEPVKSDLPSNDPMGLAFFSSRGPTNDGRLKPDVVGPGTNILSLWSSKTSATGWGTSTYPNYIYMGGTSMSCPITAGTAALVREYYNRTLGMDAPSGALIKATLINGAVDMTPGQFGSDNATTQEINRRPDMDQGWGRIDLGNSLYPDNGSMHFIDEHDGLETDENISRSFNVLPGNDMRLSLVWSDYPAAVVSAKQLVNDLDITLLSPDGTIYHGNDLTYPFNDFRDDVNPVEGIAISNPTPGIWKVVVNAYNIPMGPQHFALVISGNISDLTDTSVFMDALYYSTDGDLIDIQLYDEDLSGDPSAYVNLTSDSYPLGRNVPLEQVGYPGHFQGYMTTSNVTTINTSRIFTSHGDKLSVEYLDASPSRSLHANATAKVPQRIDMTFMPEYTLIYSAGEILKIEGTGELGLDPYFTFPGNGIEWIPLFDDGDPLNGDKEANDGNYSAIWTVPDNLNLSSNLTTLVRDPYLGDQINASYNIKFDTSLPRWPKNVSVEIIPEGNTLNISWNESNETDISIYNIYVNSSSSMMALDHPGWEYLTSTVGPWDNITIDGFVDGLEYLIRVSSVDGNGNESSLSLPINATTLDTVAPNISMITTPRMLVGTAWFNFTGSVDLEAVEIQWYDDLNGNGLDDDGLSWIYAGTGPSHYLVWDTSVEAGGPGDTEHLLLRYRGFDEVPNPSNWTVIAGFKVDNTGPASIGVSTNLPRITNIETWEVQGISEPDGYVLVYRNDELIDNATCSPGGGVFNFTLVLGEGFNVINLTAYDSVGAGPTNATYNITLDTMEPTVEFDVENQTLITREISWDGAMINSTSMDRGLDPEYTHIANWTWKLDLPAGSVQFLNDNDSFHLIYAETGLYNLTLTVTDMAGNSNSSVLSIMIIDTTAPTVNISGPIEVDERITAIFSTDGTIDNDPGWRVREGTGYRWFFEGYGGWNISATDQNVYIRFPGPGFYDVTLWVTDGYGNTGESTIIIEVLDTTAPDGTIEGPRHVILGEPATYRANVTDNDPTFPSGITFDWNLSYRDGPEEGHWSIYRQGMDFTHNFTQAGTYYLKLTVYDSAGNTRIIELPLDAEGDITPPGIEVISPLPNASFRYKEDVKFYVIFNEEMDEETINVSSIYISENGTVVPGLQITVVEHRFTDGRVGSRVNVLHPVLNFSRTYTLHVMTTISDAWGNGLFEGLSQDYIIRTPYELDYPMGVHPSARDENFSWDDNITLRFTSPVDMESLRANIRLFQVTDSGRSLEEINLMPGQDPYTVMINGSFGQGLEYQVIIDSTAVDIYGYELDNTYQWLFKTYLPSTISDDDDDDGGDDPADGWSLQYLWCLIPGIVAVILLVIIVIIVNIIVKARHKDKMKKVWKEDGESADEDDEVEVITTKKPIPTPLENELTVTPKKAPEPPSYEDLYGTQSVQEPVQEQEMTPPYEQEIPEKYEIPDEPEMPIEPPIPPTIPGRDDDIEWDGEPDTEEPEGWGDGNGDQEEEESEGWGDDEAAPEEEESWGEESSEWDDGEEENPWGDEGGDWD